MDLLQQAMRLAKYTPHPPRKIKIANLTPNKVAIPITRIEPEKPPEPEPQLVAQEPPKTTAHEILAEVARKHGLSVVAIKGEGRQRALTKARQEYAYRCLSETMLGTTQIGNVIRRDRTTIMHCANAHCYWNNIPLPRGADWSLHKVTRFRKREAA